MVYPHELGPEFDQLDHLIGLRISSSLITGINLVALRSWRKLETLELWTLLQWAMGNDIWQLQSPRLHHVSLHGIPECPRPKGGIDHYKCINTSAPSVCPGVPEYHFPVVGDSVISHRCVEPSCSTRLHWFSNNIDMNKDGLLDFNEVSADSWGPDAESMDCVLRHGRNASLQAGIIRESDLYSGQLPRHGITPQEYMFKMSVGYTTCGECDQTKAIISRGEEMFEQCTSKGIFVATSFEESYGLEMQRRACHTQITICADWCRPQYAFFSSFDVDDDGFLTEHEYKSVLATGGLMFPIGSFHCLHLLDPLCMDGGDGPRKLSIGRVLAVHNPLNPSTCADCEGLVSQSHQLQPVTVHEECAEHTSSMPAALRTGATQLSDWCEPASSKCEDGYLQCSQTLKFFSDFDFDGDGFLNEVEYTAAGVAMQFQFAPGFFKCLAKLSPTCLDADASGGLRLDIGRATSIGLASTGFPATTCGDCDMTAADVCAPFVFIVPDHFPQQCEPDSTECLAGCQEELAWFHSYDVDSDGFMSEQEYRTALLAVGYPVASGVFECMASISPTCVDADSSKGLKIQIGRLISFARAFNGKPTTTCEQCDRL